MARYMVLDQDDAKQEELIREKREEVGVLDQNILNLVRDIESLKGRQERSDHELSTAVSSLQRQMENLPTKDDVRSIFQECADNPDSPICKMARMAGVEGATEALQDTRGQEFVEDEGGFGGHGRSAQEILDCPECSSSFVKAGSKHSDFIRDLLGAIPQENIGIVAQALQNRGFEVEGLEKDDDEGNDSW